MFWEPARMGMSEPPLTKKSHAQSKDRSHSSFPSSGSLRRGTRRSPILKKTYWISGIVTRLLKHELRMLKENLTGDWTEPKKPLTACVHLLTAICVVALTGYVIPKVLFVLLRS